MKCAKKLLWLVAGLSFLTDARADQGRSVYDKIPERNVFGLAQRGMEPPPETPPPESAQIKLTGLSTIMGARRAFLMIQQPGAAKGKEESYILTVGERQGGYELMDIDTKGGTAKLKAGEQTMVLNLAAAKLPAGPAEPPQGPGPGQGRGGIGLGRLPNRPPRTAEPVPLPPMPPLPQGALEAAAQPAPEDGGTP